MPPTIQLATWRRGCVGVTTGGGAAITGGGSCGMRRRCS